MQARTATPAQRPPRVVAARWLLADARDVAFIDGAKRGDGHSVPSIAAGVASWQRTIGRRRMVALVRRALIVGFAAACVLQVGALVAGNAGLGLWLLPALVLTVLCLVPGVAHRTSAAIAARMLDRDLRLGAGVTTALELERGPANGPRGGLGALALADGKTALAGSFGGARARLKPRRREAGLLAGLVAALVVLLLLPAVHRGDGVAVKPAGPASHHRLAIHGGTSATNQPAGPDLSGFGKDVPTPSLTGIGASSTRTGGATSKTNPYGGGTGTSNHSPTGSVQPASRTVGNAGDLQSSHTNSSKTSGASEGKAGGGKATLTTHEAPAAGKITSAGPGKTSPVVGGQQADGADSTPGTPAKAGSQSGAKKGGGGAASAGRNDSQAGGPRQATPGGATAGGTRGTRASANGVVPQLGAGKALPIQPGYEAVKGTKGAKGEGATSANGAGGASHSGQATAGATGTAGGGVAYVPPGSAAVAPVDRQLLRGYFGSFARVAAAGW
jgi:hypothetical protein